MNEEQVHAKLEHDRFHMFDQVPHTITFNRRDHTVAGILDLDDGGKVTFKGDVDESAQILFDAFIDLINANVRKPLLVQIDQLNEALTEATTK